MLIKKNPKNIKDKLENISRKKKIEQPPPEQSIAVRRGPGRPLGSKNRPRISVNIPPKPKFLGDINMITPMGAATKPPKGAAKGPKSPLSRRIKDLE